MGGASHISTFMLLGVVVGASYFGGFASWRKSGAEEVTSNPSNAQRPSHVSAR